MLCGKIKCDNKLSVGVQRKSCGENRGTMLGVYGLEQTCNVYDVDRY